MKRFGKLKAIYLSFFSKELYRDVATHWRGSAALYLFILLALVWIPDTLFYTKHNDFFQEDAPQIIKHLPEITINEGTASIDEDVPLTIKTENLIIIIDTSGQITSLEGSDANVLLTQSDFHVKNPQDRISTYDLQGFKNMTVGKPEAQHALETARSWFPIVSYPFLLAVSFVFRLLQAFVYSLLAQLFALILGVTLSYAQIFRVTVVALTPTIVAASIMPWISLHVPLMFIVYIILAMSYIWFGIKSNKGNDTDSHYA